MPDWNQLLDEIRIQGSTHDIIRRKYLKELYEISGRNTIIYYSGWLQKPEISRAQVGINDYDKVGFMTTIHGLDRTKSLDQAKIPIWQPIIAKYSPTLVGEAQKAIAWSEEIVKEWLVSGMLEGETGRESKADKIVKELGDHALTKSHARHLSASRCKDIGLNIEMLEGDQKLQEGVLTVHHACIHTLSSTGAFKIIENHEGKAFIQLARTAIIPAGPIVQPPSVPE